MLIKFEVIANVSAMIYDGDKEHMLHLFEDIHFMLFFVMIIFLIEAVILIAATLNAERDALAAGAALDFWLADDDGGAHGGDVVEVVDDLDAPAFVTKPSVVDVVLRRMKVVE